MNAGFGGSTLPSPWEEYGGKLPETISAARRDLEPLFRKLISDFCPNVEFVNGTVVSLIVAANGSISEVAARMEDGSNVKYPCALVTGECSDGHGNTQNDPPVLDCTGSSQVGSKLLSRAVPGIPKDLREVYDPDTAYTTLEFPLPPNFEDDLRALKIPKLTGRGLYDTDRCHAYFVYNPDPRDDCRLLAVTRRDTDGGERPSRNLARACSFATVSVIMCFGGWGTELPVSLDEARSFTRKVKNAKHIPDYFYKLLDLFEPVSDECVAYPAKTSG